MTDDERRADVGARRDPDSDELESIKSSIMEIRRILCDDNRNQEIQ